MPTCTIELSPFVGIEVLNALTHRSYVPKEYNQISYIMLDEYSPGRLDNYSCPDFLKVKAIVGEYEDWGDVVARGFGAEQLADIFSYYAKSDGIHAYGAWLDGKLCGGATIAIFDRIADLEVTSTLEEYRGKRVQKALLRERLRVAKKNGVKRAVVTAEPGSISDLNIQKIGFFPAYTRVAFVKKLAV